VVVALVAVVVVTATAAALLPDRGGESIVAGANAALGLVSAALGGYARARSTASDGTLAEMLNNKLKELET
jgi:hypothetical protein